MDTQARRINKRSRDDHEDTPKKSLARKKTVKKSHRVHGQVCTVCPASLSFTVRRLVLNAIDALSMQCFTTAIETMDNRTSYKRDYYTLERSLLLLCLHIGMFPAFEMLLRRGSSAGCLQLDDWYTAYRSSFIKKFVRAVQTYAGDAFCPHAHPEPLFTPAHVARVGTICMSIRENCPALPLDILREIMVFAGNGCPCIEQHENVDITPGLTKYYKRSQTVTNNDHRPSPQP